MDCRWNLSVRESEKERDTMEVRSRRYCGEGTERDSERETELAQLVSPSRQCRQCRQSKAPSESQ